VALAAEANRRAWNYLASVHSSASRPWPRGTEAQRRAWVDEFSWLPWDELRSVLVLCGAGGQQAPVFATAGLQVTVVDISEHQLAIDKRIANRRGLDIECIRSDVADTAVLEGRTFDLVYQPVSTCYLPDPRCCYRTAAKALRPGGLYLSDHWNPAQMQLADEQWDGSAYRVAHRSGSGEPLTIKDPSTVDGPQCRYFAHRLQDLIGGICDAGFTIERFAERGAVDAGAAPGTREHLGAYLEPFFEILARRRAHEPVPRTVRRPSLIVGRPQDRADLTQRWRRNGFIVLRNVLEPTSLVPALRREALSQRSSATESKWSGYALSDDRTYVSGGMCFTSAQPGPVLTRLHRSPQLQSLVRAVTGSHRISACDNLAYMYYEESSFINVHTDVAECEVTVLTSTIGQAPPLVAYPRLRGMTPEQLLAVARRAGGCPRGGTSLRVPVGGLLILDGRRLPHRRPVVAAGQGPFGIAALCFAEQ
jgi:SAM-dependent methyltransferase